MADLPDPAPAPTPSFLDRLGPRAVRRMTPRVGVAIAGAGALIAVAGATGLGGDQLIGDDGDVERIPGILLSALVIIAGYVTLARVRSGALATAGATAAALGVPTLLFFLTFSESDFPPFSLDAILLVSSIAWIVAYLAGPSAGRVLFLAAALVGAWLFVLNLVEPVERLTPFGLLGASMDDVQVLDPPMPTPTPTFDAPVFDGPTFEIEPPAFDDSTFQVEPPTFDEDDFSFEGPDLTDVAVVSLLFGSAYAVAGLLLSRRGHHGAGTPFAAVAVIALALGVQLLAPELEQAGTGLLAIAVGLGLAAVGAASGRRATTWIGAAGVGLGAVAVLQTTVDDGSASAQSFAFLLLGVVVVVVGHLVAVALGEPDEERVEPSFAARAQGPGSGPAPVEIDLE